MSKKSKKDTITINKKIIFGVAPALPIIGILLSKKEPGALLLFLIGIVCGVLIGKFSKV
jgi:hypothetical protein